MTDLPQSLDETGPMHDRIIGQAESYERPPKRQRLAISMLLATNERASDMGAPAAESPLQQAFLTPLPSNPIGHQSPPSMSLTRSVEVVGADTSAPMADAGIPSSSEKAVNDGVGSELLLPSATPSEQHEFGTSQGGCQVANFTYASSVLHYLDDDALIAFGLNPGI